MIKEKLQKGLPADLLDKFHIMVDQYEDFIDNKIRVLIVTCLPNDDNVQHLNDGGWKKFDLIVFSSFWQQSIYKVLFGIPYSISTVVRDSYDTLYKVNEDDPKIRILYNAGPHDGLELLFVVLKNMETDWPHVELDVLSNIKGSNIEELEELIEKSNNINLLESEKDLRSYNLFVLPGISPLSNSSTLLKALSSGLVCVHSTNSCLPELSMSVSYMYEHTEDAQAHVARLFLSLREVLDRIDNKDQSIEEMVELQKKLFTEQNLWSNRKQEWETVLKGLLT